MSWLKTAIEAGTGVTPDGLPLTCEVLPPIGSEGLGDLAARRWRLESAHLRLLRGFDELLCLDGLTGVQRFFASWAAGWRQVIRSEEAVRRLATDPHSPNEFRTNQIARNLDAFHEAFGTAEQDGMWMPVTERVSIW